MSRRPSRHGEPEPVLRASGVTPGLENATPTDRLTLAERLNFLVTNRLPRHAATRFMGWFSQIRNPLVARASIGLWKRFVDDLRLDEAEGAPYPSMHACFTRRLKPGARVIDPEPGVLVSPCDAVLGAHGSLSGLEALQAKGFPYRIDELLGDATTADTLRDGFFVTLRLKSSMYHRFHAPDQGTVDRLRYISGDTWNVNPVALKVVERLFCRNERVVFPFRLTSDGSTLQLVAVAAILVASVRVHGLASPLNLAWRGANELPLERRYQRGEEMGYFEHGSTIIVLTPPGFHLHERRQFGETVRMGEPLLRRTGRPVTGLSSQ